ncbi:hypothetical protein [Streptomyces sp. OspMP-M43]|uniref:hypothetical protein n=1 Tax=Streptomyces sp. OspMP-M43 TaxID=1839781 RepID=UPI00114CA627|nr:hypothetical protein [Streptomyces sp. OspMP-M43]
MKRVVWTVLVSVGLGAVACAGTGEGPARATRAPEVPQSPRVVGSKLTAPVVMSSVGGLADDNTVVGMAVVEGEDRAFPVVWPTGTAGEELALSVESVNSSALAISGNGDVAGQHISEEHLVGVVRWAPGGQAAVPVEMETLGGPLTSVKDMNASGEAVGISQTGDGEVPQAVRWDRSGAVTALGPLTESHVSAAFGMNDEGVVVGQSGLTDLLGPAVRWDRDGTITELALPAWARSAVANAVNRAGVIVGAAGTEDVLGHIRDTEPTVRAVRWKPGGTVDSLPAPEGAASAAWDINDAGEAVGALRLPGGTERAVRWSPDGTRTELSPLRGDTASFAHAINNRGYAAGESIDAEGRTYAVMWHPDGRVTALDRHRPSQHTTLSPTPTSH